MKHKITHNQENNKKDVLVNKSHSHLGSLVKNEIFGIGMTNASKGEILEYIIDTCKNSTKSYYIITPNPEMVVYANAHNDIKNILNNAEIALCDGVGLFAGARILGVALEERFTGVELMDKLCEKASNWPITVGFLGGGAGVADKAAECLKKKYPMLKVSFAKEEWEEGLRGPVTSHPQKVHHSSVRKGFAAGTFRGSPSRTTPSHNSSLITPSFSIDILFVAFGFPKQEKWMAEHINKIPVKVMVGVGGAFDYISGNVPRPPRIVRNLGLEWLFRLVVQPWRWRRQLALLKFIWMVLKGKFSSDL